ncbi:class C sortase [Actinomyces minihominis]|uniref:class C sortase n=1 Tax=Actinomyces minihominis TaxID=2002838 RepID=UPI0013EB5F82|nr:class C sortase [Actinomyces minihominis]
MNSDLRTSPHPSRRSLREARPRQKKEPGHSHAKLIIGLVVIVVGLLLLTFPAVAKWWTNAGHSQDLAEYSLAQPPDRDEKFALAVSANEAGDLSGAGRALELEGSRVRARVQVPSVGIDLPVYATSSEENLLKGAAILEGTSLPVGGSGTSAAITAHSGMITASMFDALPQLGLGDLIYIDVLGQTLTYSVVDHVVDTPEDGLHHLRAQPGRDLLSLVTCTPYGVNTHRLLVIAERVEAIATHTENPIAIPLEGPVILGKTPVTTALIVGTLLTLALVANSVRKRRSKPYEANQSLSPAHAAAP